MLTAVAVAGLGLLPAPTRAQSTTLSGGLDLRAGLRVHPQVDAVTGLSGSFVNLRKVFADTKGDRFILVGQVDVEEEIRDTHLYNVYAQYKGSLGRWNLRIGRYLVPFGLLAYLDTERLPLPAHEAEALGIKVDEGVQLNGYVGAVDYALSVTRGLDNHPTPNLRLGWQGQDTRLGLSYLYGRLPSFADQESVGTDELLPGAVLIRKHRLALDHERVLGPLTLRAEPVAGADEGRFSFGLYLETSYALSPRWEVSGNAAVFRSDLVGRRRRAGASVSFNVARGLFVRGAYLHRDDMGKSAGTVLVQAYGEFSKVLGK